MGSTTSKAPPQQDLKNRPLKFVFQGLHGSGKTSMLYRLKHGEMMTDVFSSIGVDFQILYEDDQKYQAWDIAGRGNTRSLYRAYMRGATGFVYMIDSTDVDNIGESMDELSITILPNEHAQNTVVMVVANKQDLDNAMGPEEIECKLKGIYKIESGITMFVMPCSVKTGEGVQLAFEYFSMLMKKKVQGSKVQVGLIPHAWERAEQELENEKARNETGVVDLNTDDVTTKIDDGTTKTVDAVTTKESVESTKKHNKKAKSFLKNPVKTLMAILSY